MKCFSTLKLVLLSILLTSTARAAIGISADVGVRSVNPNALNGTSTVDALQIKSEITYGVEIRHKGRIPIGLRFDNESAGKTATLAGAPAERKFNANWLSLIAGYTFLGETATGWQASLVGQYGLLNSSKVTITDSINNFSNVTGKTASSYGAQVEVQKAWSHFVLGLQLGYLQRKVSDFEATPGSFINDAKGNRLEVDVSGPITNLIVGFRF